MSLLSSEKIVALRTIFSILANSMHLRENTAIFHYEKPFEDSGYMLCWELCQYKEGGQANT